MKESRAALMAAAAAAAAMPGDSPWDFRQNDGAFSDAAAQTMRIKKDGKDAGTMLGQCLEDAWMRLPWLRRLPWLPALIAPPASQVDFRSCALFGVLPRRLLC